MQPVFIMMIGVSASGKSTIAKYLSSLYNIKIHPSDELRKELLGDYTDQSKNSEIFTELRRRIKKDLSLGNNVICDATNLTIKTRKNILNEIKKINCYKIGYVVVKNYSNLINDNIERAYSVPEYVIKKQILRFQIPFIEEGFDKIIINDNNKINENKNKITNERIEIIKKMNLFNQETKWHKYSLGQHCKILSDNLYNITHNKTMREIGLFHDVGKLFTKSYDENGIAHYYNHHNVGAYYLLCHPELLYYANEKEFMDIIFYTNYHMDVFFWKEEKTHKKYKEIFGRTKYNNLILINEQDKIASGI